MRIEWPSTQTKPHFPTKDAWISDLWFSSLETKSINRGLHFDHGRKQKEHSLRLWFSQKRNPVPKFNLSVGNVSPLSLLIDVHRHGTLSEFLYRISLHNAAVRLTVWCASAVSYEFLGMELRESVWAPLQASLSRNWIELQSSGALKQIPQRSRGRLTRWCACPIWQIPSYISPWCHDNVASVSR